MFVINTCLYIVLLIKWNKVIKSVIYRDETVYTNLKMSGVEECWKQRNNWEFLCNVEKCFVCFFISLIV